MLSIEHLTKTYGKTIAVDDLTLTTRAGEIHALLGPNGAGKSTTLRCAIGLTHPSSGSIRIDTHDISRAPQEAKRHLGFIPDRAWFYPKATGRELLRYVASVRRVSDADQHIDALLTRFRLVDAADARTETYSHGMRQRLAFCVALIGDPRLLVVDEPMVGLDVQGHRDVKRLFREIAASGRTVLLTTHTLAVAEEISDRITLINHGRVVADGTIDEIRTHADLRDGNLEDLYLKLTEPADSAALSEQAA